MILEIAAFSVRAAIKAAQLGAHRIELCYGYSNGGLTPTPAALRAVKEAVQIPVFVMIRCREGNFNYTPDEIQLMQHEMTSLKDLGADGFVIGAVNNQGGVDTAALQRLMECAKGLPITFHRAFDTLQHYEKALEVLIQLGIQRVLTSGGESNVEAGINNLKKWNESYSNKIIILPGGGVTSKNISSLKELAGCTEFHSSAKGITTPTPFGSNIEPDPEELQLLLHAIR